MTQKKSGSRSKTAIGTLRDPAKTQEHYLACIEFLEKSIDASLKGTKPVMFKPAADYALRICRAAYSAGETSAQCGRRLEKAAEFRRRFFEEGVTSKLTGLEQIEEYLESFSGAYLVDKSDQVVAAFERVKPPKVALWQQTIVDWFCAVLKGERFRVEAAAVTAVKGFKDYAALPDLFKAIETKDSELFTQSLELFLTKSWGPPVDRGARRELKLAYPAYCGKWSFFSAAVSKMMGAVPALSSKALQYLPADLVDA